jgi:hypothetical protein
MRVFISWSGRHSRAVAEALRDWLPLVINDVQPFMSAEDIDAGARWQMEIATQLEETHFGLICVTRANQTAPWLNFEAGALAKAVGGSRVVPLAIDCKPTDIPPPLGQFQAQSSTREGIGRVLTALNNTLDTPLPATRLVPYQTAFALLGEETPSRRYGALLDAAILSLVTEGGSGAV